MKESKMYALVRMGRKQIEYLIQNFQILLIQRITEERKFALNQR